MSVYIKKIAGIVLLMCFLTGCGGSHTPPPKTVYPIEIKREFHASFDKTWESVLEVIRISNGTILTEDKSLGLITYSISDSNSVSLSYMNVYLKSGLSPNTTTVFLTAREQSGTFIYPTSREHDKIFFDRLTNLLGGAKND